MGLEMIGITIATPDGKITNTIKPDKPGKNYYAQQLVFSKYQQETQNTDGVDKVTLTLNNNNASERDKNSFDIYARALNVSGPNLMKGSDMQKIADKINEDDFKDGKLQVTSDGEIQIFSKEKDGYGIVDKEGNQYKFDINGKLINSDLKGE